MLGDGIYVLGHGKYIGPDTPGLWASLFKSAKINVFHLGPLFICFGIGWLLYVISIFTNARWSKQAGIFMSVLTLWYLPFGTICSLIILVILLSSRKK